MTPTMIVIIRIIPQNMPTTVKPRTAPELLLSLFVLLSSVVSFVVLGALGVVGRVVSSVFSQMSGLLTIEEAWAQSADVLA